MLNIFYIKFDQPDAVYVPGGIVSGCVVIDLTRKKVIEALTLSANGETNIRWIDTIFISQGNERYFDLTILLLKRTEGGGRVHLPAGVSRYPFCIKLPRNIPCSFEQCNGYIRYTIKANFIQSWQFTHECEAGFTVIAAYDLNLRREQCISICDKVNQAYSCLCCISNSWINMNIKLATTGFVPGQWIVAIFDLRDTTNINLREICVKLQQFFEFRATTSRKYVKATVAAVQQKGPFNKDAVIALQLQIPAVPPSELEFCNVIRLKYVLRIILRSSKMYRKIVRQYPILIGTIPLRPALSVPAVSSSSHVSQSTSKNENVPMTPESAIAPNALCSVSPSMNEFLEPPLSYEECYMARKASHCIQDPLFVLGTYEPFVPKYPVFKFRISHPP